MRLLDFALRLTVRLLHPSSIAEYILTHYEQTDDQTGTESSNPSPNDTPQPKLEFSSAAYDFSPSFVP